MVLLANLLRPTFTRFQLLIQLYLSRHQFLKLHLQAYSIEVFAVADLIDTRLVKLWVCLAPSWEVQNFPYKMLTKLLCKTVDSVGGGD